MWWQVLICIIWSACFALTATSWEGPFPTKSTAFKIPALSALMV
jgi:hypothetical protein